MQELYSKDEDCLELYKILKKKMGDKIDCYGTPYTPLFSGKYFSHWLARGINFYYKYCKNGFLRIQIGGSIHHNASVGERLAALSDFYEALSEEFGEPTVFYTTKDDDEGLLSMHWSFINKEEDIQKFKEGSYFDDVETDELIIMGESKQTTEGYQLNDLTKKMISRQIGLPFELLPLVDENIEDFIKFNTGKELSTLAEIKTDEEPTTSLETNMSLQRKNK